MSTVLQDFFLHPAERLTEQERALMSGMLADLLGSIAVEIRAALPPRLGAANDGDGEQLVRQLIAARLLDQRELIALLLRKADEERIGSAVQARSGEPSAFLQALIAEPDEQVSAAAMALILARGRRRDRLDQPRLELDDLPAVLARALANAVAAALRLSLPAGVQASEADQHHELAAARLLAQHDPDKSVESVTAALVRALMEADKLEEGLLAAAAEEGDVGFLAEALTERAGVGSDVAWDHMMNARSGGFVLLLRMAGVSRDLAARLLAGLGDLIGIFDLGQEIARFEQLDEERVASARQWLALEPSYRTALAALGALNG